MKIKTPSLFLLILTTLHQAMLPVLQQVLLTFILLPIQLKEQNQLMSKRVKKTDLPIIKKQVKFEDIRKRLAVMVAVEDFRVIVREDISQVTDSTILTLSVAALSSILAKVRTIGDLRQGWQFC